MVEMDINKAIEHFAWKLQNHWKPTPKDIEAFNAVLNYKKMQEDINLQRNENLAKMWVKTFITMSNTNLYNAETIINEIDKDLSKSVYDWCLILKEQLPMMRFNSIGRNKYPPPQDYNITKIQENNAKIIAEFETELTQALNYKPKEDDVIRFVTSQINRIIDKFEKNPTL